MSFGERMRIRRIELDLTQNELAKKSELSTLSIMNYESGKRYPNVPILKRIAEALETTAQDLMEEEDRQITEAYERGGGKAKREMRVLTAQVAGMFAGGDLSEDDRDAAMRAISEAYWIAKEKNKIFTPKKYRKDEDTGEE